jgi:phenylacetate-coenzyme A ligase PaaK-like adenylate-forming protein
MKKLSLEEALEYAVDNVDFYSSKERYSIIKKEKIDKNILTRLPVIDSSIFKDPANLIPKNNKYINVFLSSGSTGKPKKIPRSFYDTCNLANSLVIEIKNYVKGSPSTVLSMLPPKPAVSGYAGSLAVSALNAIEVNIGPGQTFVDALSIADYFSQNSNKKNNYLLIFGFPSNIFRDLYRYNKDDLDKIDEISRRNRIVILTGGESLTGERAKLFRKYIKYESIINFLASTEGVSATSFYTGEEIDSGISAHSFKFSDYNNEAGLLTSEGKVIIPSIEDIGLEGELLLSSKIGKKQNSVPLINYRTGDNIKITGFSNEGNLEFRLLDRVDNIKRFRISKLNSQIVDEVIASSINKFGTREGYSELLRENGIDVLRFYLDKGSYNGDSETLLSYIKSSLASKEMELAYVINNDLAKVDLEIVDKDKIPFYTDRGKTKRLIDKREY